MKNLTIEVKKADVLNEVSLATAYIGVKGDKPETAFHKVATLDSDNELLSRLWTRMAGIVQDKFKCFITTSDFTADHLKIDMELSNAYDDSLSESVKNDIFSAITAGITAKWMGFSSSQKASEWEISASQSIASAFAKLCHRRKPERKTYQ